MHNLATPPPPLLRTGIPRPASLPAPPRRARDQTRHHGIPTDHRPRSPNVLASAATDQQMSPSIEPPRVPVVQPCRSCITVPDPAKRTHTAVFPCTKTIRRLHAGFTTCAAVCCVSCVMMNHARHVCMCAADAPSLSERLIGRIQVVPTERWNDATTASLPSSPDT